MSSFLTPARRLFFLGLALPSIALAQTLSVDATQTVRTVDERVFGLNATLWDPQAGSPQTISLLKAADVRAIRVPGGSLSDEYHWKSNTNLDNTWTWAAGFNVFTQLITGLDIQTFVTVNYGTGTPEEAAAWVAYANASATLLNTSADVPIGVDAKGVDWKTAGYWSNLRNSGPLATNDGMNFLRLSRAAPIRLKYWEIGNECYGTWETDEQAQAHNPTTYANRSQSYIAKMKAVDPTIKVGVVTVNGTQYNNWTRTVLNRLKELSVTPDFIIYHRYEQAPAADSPGSPESDTRLLQLAKTWPSDATDLRQQVTAAFGAAGSAIEIVVTENNSVYAKPGRQTTSLVNGLFLADSVGNLLQTEFNALLWWDLRNGQETGNNNSSSLYGWRGYGDYGILSTPSTGGSSTYNDPYPTYYIMKLLSNFARGGDTIVRATSSSTLLSIFAARRPDGSLGLLVINKDPANTLNASIALTGHTPAATASVYAYGMAQDNAAKPGGSGSADIASSFMNISGPNFSASFAPYSATVITLAAGSGTTTPPTPTPPSPPPSSSGGGGGGGGAIDAWFAGALALLGIARWIRRKG